VQNVKQKLSRLRNFRLATRVLLALFAALIICVIFIGLDNSTGIILGWLAAVALIMSMAHKWRKIWHFLVLLAVSFIGAIILSALYMEVALPLAGWFGGVNAPQSVAWRVFHVVVSDVILLFTPMGIIIGIVGTIWLGILRLVTLRDRRRQSGT
jgi:hypothetical protein